MSGFWVAAQTDPEHLALVEPDGTEHSAARLLASCNQVVHGLRALGFDPGDTVAAMLPNGAAIIELYLAALQAGWYIVPINYHLTAPEVAYILADSDAKAFVGHEALADACLGAVGETKFHEKARFSVGTLPGFRPYAELKEGQPTDLPEDRSTGAVMTYTAGTTGKPKGVRRPTPSVDPDTNGMLNGLFLTLFGIQPLDDNVHLTVSPLYHTAVVNFTLDSLHLGHSVVLMDKWTPEETLRLIERYRVTTSHMVPTQFHRLLQLPDDVKKKADVSSLRVMVHSAAPCPPDVKRRMIEWWGNVIYEYYAATEGGGTLVTPEEWMKKPGTVGKPWPISEISILDDAEQPAPAGQPGTVYIKMGDYGFEYHKDKEKTDKSWKEGFFTVGDIGYLDEDGYLFLCDRKIDMIISGGVNIYPAEIEGVLLSHPKVGDAAVFGIPHDDWGEEVKAVIEPAAGVAPGDALTGDLDAFCRERLAKYKCPRTYDFVDVLPRDPNGKLYKRALRDPYWQGRERAI
ncbi:MAG: acyl-CoA synthetase [Actinomycetota bacterium]|nr:acyl-CoA synthetase [Actinomycetota bacterium]